MCAVPAGKFWMGDEPRLTETDAYQIAETPVTNAQFAQFLQQLGYRERAHWSEEGWEWRSRNAIEKPRFWDDPEWSAYLGPDQPVVGVSWYEADAFARSLGMRLPTEAEWERAARGDEGRVYPWGDEWVPGYAAHRGSNSGSPPAPSAEGTAR